ncbi:hypothetical protein SDC9_152328 [bioreactor metagenome]|uniref:Uncharacterized protein n=1 Tax=bioreactor metagenome TaxID=1076179 RepID=A0A645EST5_9ZZZZ
MKGAGLDALSAFDAFGIIDPGHLIDHADRLFRAGINARTRKTAAAVAGHHQTRVGTCRTARGTDRKRPFLSGFPVSRENIPVIFRKRLRLVCLVLAEKTEKRHQTIFDHRSVMVDAAARGRRILRTHPDRNMV